MRLKHIVVPLVIAAVAVSLVSGLSAGQKDKAKDKKGAQAKAQPQIFIPPQVQAVMKEGLEARQGRQDIPVNIFYTLFLPTRDPGNFHNVFFLKIKNGDLGFVPVEAAPPPPPPQKKGPQEAVPQEPPAELRASFNVFLQFNKLGEIAEPQIAKEVFVPATIQIPGAEYDPEKVETYSLGYPMPFGRYVVAIAVTSLDLQKIGVAYAEIETPDPGQFAKSLGTTSVFFIKQMDQMEGVEQQTFLHKGFFTYANYKIVPNTDLIFNPGDMMDIFFFIFGARPNEQQQFQIEVNFEVKQGEEFAIRWSPQTYPNPLISQPLPLKQTVRIKDDKGERTEQRDLPPGNYTLAISIKDLVSGNSGAKTVNFEMK